MKKCNCVNGEGLCERLDEHIQEASQTEQPMAGMPSESCDTPKEELVARKCWVPDCQHLAAFRDGAGWWWCFLHQDRQMWGVAEYPDYATTVKNARKCFDEGHKQGRDSRDEAISYSGQVTKLINEHERLKADLAKSREAVKALMEYVEHSKECILSFWERGEPTPDGGYRTMYAGKWYQNRPVDETPKCNCGLAEIWPPTGSGDKETKEEKKYE